MIDITLYKSSVLCKFDLRFKSYGKSCKVRLILFGLVTKEGWAVAIDSILHFLEDRHLAKYLCAA